MTLFGNQISENSSRETIFDFQHQIKIGRILPKCQKISGHKSFHVESKSFKKSHLEQQRVVADEIARLKMSLRSTLRPLTPAHHDYSDYGNTVAYDAAFPVAPTRRPKFTPKVHLVYTQKTPKYPQVANIKIARPSSNQSGNKIDRGNAPNFES